jgi:hypothetical protein
MVWSLIAGAVTIFGTFSLQHSLLKMFDPLIVSMAFQFEPLVSLLICTVVGIQEIEYSSFILFAVFLVLPNMLAVAGIRQFEDKYEGGILGMSQEQRNELRIEHLRELQLLGIGDSSDSLSRN